MKTLQNKFDIIILSLVVDKLTFTQTKCCIDSYINTADELINKVYVIESGPDNLNYSYKQDKVEIIFPNKEFNYNEFYNIGLEKCKADFIAGPNNDVILKPNCMQTLLEEFNNNPYVDSLSPINRNWFRHTTTHFPNENKVYLGYEISLHLSGYMFACRRSVFEKIGYLDEQFYFFYQDNDYAMCLNRNNLIHGIHTGAHVFHQGHSTDEYAKPKFRNIPENMIKQHKIFINKWSNTEPFKSGGYKPYKPYVLS